jgi:hypothetical protein
MSHVVPCEPSDGSMGALIVWTCAAIFLIIVTG